MKFTDLHIIPMMWDKVNSHFFYTLLLKEEDSCSCFHVSPTPKGLLTTQKWQMSCMMRAHHHIHGSGRLEILTATLIAINAKLTIKPQYYTYK